MGHVDSASVGMRVAVCRQQAVMWTVRAWDPLTNR